MKKYLLILLAINVTSYAMELNYDNGFTSEEVRYHKFGIYEREKLNQHHENLLRLINFYISGFEQYEKEKKLDNLQKNNTKKRKIASISSQ